MLGTPEFQAIAKLDKDGGLGLTVTAFCGYGSRTTARSVSVTLDEKDAAKITAILEHAIAAASVTVVTGRGDAKSEKELPLGQMVFSDAAECLTVATKNGEEV